MLAGATPLKTDRRSAIPIITPVIVALAWAAYHWPVLADFLIFDRSAVSAGEWWRILTSPLVHFSASHLLWNGLVLLLAGWVVERSHRPALLFLLVMPSIMTSIYLMVCRPDILWFGGLSGNATALVVFLAIERSRCPNPGQRIWQLLLLLAFAKVGFELLGGQAIFAGSEFIMLPAAHLAGLVSVIMLIVGQHFLLFPTRGNRPSSRELTHRSQ